MFSVHGTVVCWTVGYTIIQIIHGDGFCSLAFLFYYDALLVHAHQAVCLLVRTSQELGVWGNWGRWDTQSHIFSALYLNLLIFFWSHQVSLVQGLVYYEEREAQHVPRSIWRLPWAKFLLLEVRFVKNQHLPDSLIMCAWYLYLSIYLYTCTCYISYVNIYTYAHIIILFIYVCVVLLMHKSCSPLFQPKHLRALRDRGL